MNTNQAILLNGTSSAGKSSIAQEIMKEVTCPVLHLKVDIFLENIHFKFVEDKSKMGYLYRSALDLFNKTIQNASQKEMALVIDTVIVKDEVYEAIMSALALKKVCSVGVYCDIDVAKSREVARGDRMIGLVEAQIEAVHENRPYDLKVDTTINSSEFCAKEILTFIESIPKIPNTLS